MKVDDIVYLVLKLEVEYFKWVKFFVYKMNYLYGSLYGNYSCVEGCENFE